MKAHEECGRRRDGKCLQYQGGPCQPGEQIEAGKCWRMCEERKNYLQCPICKSNLFYDLDGVNCFGFGDIFFCPKCEKTVNRSEAVQTLSRLGKMLKKNKKIVEEYEAYPGFLGPKGCDTLNAARYEVKHIKEMIIALAEKE